VRVIPSAMAFRASTPSSVDDREESLVLSKEAGLLHLARVMHALLAVELGDGKALGLVRLEQAITCVPAQLRDQLPRDVLCILDTAVQTEATVRGK